MKPIFEFYKEILLDSWPYIKLVGFLYLMFLIVLAIIYFTYDEKVPLDILK